MTKKQKEELKEYEAKIKNMSKEEFKEELEEVSKLNESALILSLIIPGVEATLVAIVGWPIIKERKEELILMGVSSISAAILLFDYIKNRLTQKNKFDILLKYVDKDSEEKEKGSQKSLK